MPSPSTLSAQHPWITVGDLAGPQPNLQAGHMLLMISLIAGVVFLITGLAMIGYKTRKASRHRKVVQSVFVAIGLSILVGGQFFFRTAQSLTENPANLYSSGDLLILGEAPPSAPPMTSKPMSKPEGQHE